MRKFAGKLPQPLGLPGSDPAEEEEEDEEDEDEDEECSTRV